MQTDGQMDGRTDMTKLRVTFCNFAHSPKNALNIESTQNNTIIF